MTIQNKPLFIKSLALSILIIIVDQIIKMMVLDVLLKDPHITITSFFNLVLVYNRGVSFGMLNTGHDFMPLLLIVLSSIIILSLIFWLSRVIYRFTAIALAMVIGGAIGNAIDRAHIGAVVDFLDFHAFGYHWPAFNVADSAIVIGVSLLFIDSLFSDNKTKL